MRGIVAGVMISLGVSGFALAQEAKIVELDTLNVRDVLYHLTGGGGNGLALIDELNGGVVLIDTKSAGWGEAVLEVIAQVTDLPVTTIVNTHAHPDHAGSNGEFPDVVDIVAHGNAAAAMTRGNGDSNGLPTVTFNDRYGLLDDLDRIELYYFGPGHTDGDIIVVFPEKRVAYAGDLFPGRMAPVIDRANGGSGLAFPDTLRAIVDTIGGVDRIISGHGPFPTTYAGRGRRERGTARAWTGFLDWDDLSEYADFVRDFVAAVESAYESGRTPEAAAANLELDARYAEYDLTDVGATIMALYAELDAR